MPPARPPRLRYDGIERSFRGDNSECEIAVKLSFEDQTYQGRCQGNVGEESELELAARAALIAVGEFVQNRFECELIDVDRVEAIGSKLIVLLVRVRYQDRELQIFGSCRAGHNLLDASARAALDATNRYVELALANSDPNGASILGSPPAADLTC
jgi:hypothetical protein